MLSNLEESILRSLAYFDVFSRPLKEEEILDNLRTMRNRREMEPRSIAFGELQGRSETNAKHYHKEAEKSLNSLVFKSFIKKKNNLYFLNGKENLIEERKKREKISQKNWQRLEKIAKKINYIPFIRGVFVSGSLARNNSNEKSDIDLLVITKAGRIFTVRFLLTLLLDLMNERRRPGKVAGRICLNQYQTENALEVKFPSLYNGYTYLHLRPIIDRGGIFEKFRKAQGWMRKYLIFWQKKFEAPFKIEKESKVAGFLESVLRGKFGDFVERRLKDIQIKRKKDCEKGRIILTDNLIELHPYSSEERILAKYHARLDFLFKR